MTAGAWRYRAVLAYDGTDYAGFQRQSGDTPTVQGTIEAALARVTGQPVTLTGAGRTDSGVHATGQVIAFDVDWKHSASSLCRALNANLPESIALRDMVKANPVFHPRYDARSRVYEYTLLAAPVRQPLLRRSAWHVPHSGTLDVALMEVAAACVRGTHDFATFGRPPQGENTVRRVLRSEVTEHALPRSEGQIVRYVIEADAFLYRMVRRIVGALARVGTGRLSVEAFEEGLNAADNTWPNHTAPAHGLCLIDVTY